MTDDVTETFTAFEGLRRLAGGALIEVALVVKAREASGGEPILTTTVSEAIEAVLTLLGLRLAGRSIPQLVPA